MIQNLNKFLITPETDVYTKSSKVLVSLCRRSFALSLTQDIYREYRYAPAIVSTYEPRNQPFNDLEQIHVSWY